MSTAEKNKKSIRRAELNEPFAIGRIAFWTTPLI
jgi:hypothetical protein